MAKKATDGDRQSALKIKKVRQAGIKPTNRIVDSDLRLKKNIRTA